MIKGPKELKDLLQHLEEKSRSVPEDLQLLQKLGRLYLKNRSFFQAIRTFQRILALDPCFGPALVEMAIAHLALAQYDEACFALERAMEAHDNPAAVCLAFAKLYEAKKEPERQVEYLLRAANAAPERFDIRLAIGELLRRHGDFVGAKHQYEMVLLDHPFVEAARFGLGTILVREGKLNEAMGQFRRIIQNNPSAYDAHFNLAHCLYVQKKYALAIAPFEAALRGFRDHAGALFMMANCYAAVGDLDRAIVSMERAAEKKPAAMEIHKRLAELYEASGERDLACEAYRKLARRYPDRPEFPLAHARLLIDQNHLRQAEILLQEMFSRHPGNIEGHTLLGNVLLARRCFKDALQEFNKTILVNESYGPGWMGKAEVFQALGEPAEEYAMLQKLVALGEADASTYLRLGELERILKLPTSLDHFRKVTELAPDSTMAREARYYIFHESHQEAA